MLLDTQVLIWLLEDSARLGPEARRRIEGASVAHVSAASIWEMGIMVELGRLTAPEDLFTLIEVAGLQLIAISPQHTWGVRHTAGLPHRDPFDRLLVTQAVLEEFDFVTADRVILNAEVDVLVTVDARA